MAVATEKKQAQGQAAASQPADEFQPPLPPVQSVIDALDEYDREVLAARLAEPVDFMDHPALHEADADVTLFGHPAQLTARDSARFETPLRIATGRKKGATRVSTPTAQQERLLFCRFNYTRMRMDKIMRKCAGRRLPADTARRLLAFCEWERLTRERIVSLNMPLVLAMAKRTRLSGVDYNEMISEGNMALLRSVDKFDVGRGFKFSTYCCRAILKAFARVAVRAGRYRSTFPVEFDPAIERSDYLDRKRVEQEADCVDDLKIILSRNMADLTDVERIVINQRFALQRDPADAPLPKTLEQVGLIIGVTKERVRQIQNKALKKIRMAMEDNYLAA